MIEALRSLRTWRASSPSQRDHAVDLAASALGAGFVPARPRAGAEGLGTVAREDDPERLLVVVPGGRFTFGLSDRDLDELAELVDWTREVKYIVNQLKRRCRPTVEIRMRPFVIGARLLTRQTVEALSTRIGRPIPSDEMTRAEAVDITALAGARLPSEAELEWLGRGGGRHAFVYDCARRFREGRANDDPGPFGVRELLVGEWAADDWFPSHHGRSSTAAPRRGGHASGAFRGELPVGVVEDQAELCFGLAAYRNRGGVGDHARCRARLAYDLKLK